MFLEGCFEAAAAFGALPTDYMRSTPSHLHRAVVNWLKCRWNQPDRSDHYAMQIASMLSGRKGTSLDDFRIPFSWDRKETQQGRTQIIDVKPEFELRISKAEAARIAEMPLAEAAAERRRLAMERSNVK